jgi:RHS repeat-associated protein
MDKGFVGGTKDDTGLTHLGAREYDPVIGRFISADPVLDADDPQQMQGYAYANNTPLSASDADGLLFGFLANVFQKTVTSVWENAGKISTGLSIAALVCAAIPIPPIQAVAAGLAAASVVFGVIDTIKSCSEGKFVDCGVGALSMIPGGKALKIAYNGGKKMFEAGKGLDDAIERRNLYSDIFSGKKHPDPRTRPEGSRIYRNELDKNITDARKAWVESQKPASWGSSTPQNVLTDLGMLADDACTNYMSACHEPVALPRLMMIGQRKTYKPTFFCPCRPSAADVAAAKRYDQRWARFLF